jgi:hypothetical protein
MEKDGRVLLKYILKNKVIWRGVDSTGSEKFWWMYTCEPSNKLLVP